MLVLDEELATCEAQLAPLQGSARLAPLVNVAWHLRQRDPARAQLLADEAAPLAAALPDAERAPLEARLTLVRAEAVWLAGDLDGARAVAAAALHTFEQHADWAGCADGNWLRAWIDVDGGNLADSDTAMALAADYARRAGCAMRVDICDAAAALFAVFRDVHAAELRWGKRFDRDAAGVHPAARGWIDDYLGISAFQASDFGRAISLMMGSFETALATGQVRRAVNLATNIGNGFTSLNAHNAALEWMQRGLDLARPGGWPMSEGLALMQTAETLRQLGQRDAAQQLLHEALDALAPLASSRAYAVALEYQGDLAIDCGDYGAALDSFARLEVRGQALGQADFHCAARRGQADALSRLGRPQEALAMADSSLALAREHRDAYNHIAALRVLAEIHARHALPATAPLDAPNAALHYLQQALAVAATIDGYTVPAALLDAVAREYAAAGDYAAAYEAAMRAGAARETTHGTEATNRAIAMRVHYQTERAQAEGEHHRQLAAAEARRAEALQQISATLEHLSAIGQEITAHLDAAAVFRALDRHVHGLLDATHFSVFLTDADGVAMRCAFGIEAGEQLPPICVTLDDPNANSARCVRERREIMVDTDPEACAPFLIPGTLPTLSQLFAPLQVGDRVLGAMTVQSRQPNAYGERDRLIFRTLCAYGAIALDNANAYRQVAATLRTLSATQDQLLEKNLELEQAYQALEEVSLTDQLTGLRNRRFFLQHVDADVAMSLRRHDEPLRQAEREAVSDKDLVFFMVDLDHFKEVNDRHGHAGGDAVLVQMQERLREVFRESDYLIRWGGEEFLVLARATNRDDAKAVAERIRLAVADREFVLPDGTRLSKTCSIGFACFPFLPSEPRLLSWSEVVELADQGLYLAKRSGRNAWAAVYGTDSTRGEGLFPRLMQHLDQALADGEVTLVTSLQHPVLPAGPKKRRLGLAAGKVTS
jgi:diguanylate cyclase (GGDEF)-like protein